MDNLGRAITMAGSVLLFVFASSISIYLYGTLLAYLREGTGYVRMANRAESDIGVEDYANFKRDITAGEILITLMNMDQMHVVSLTIDGIGPVYAKDVEEKNTKYVNVYNELKDPNNKYLYKSHYTTVGDKSGMAVTYTIR